MSESEQGNKDKNKGAKRKLKVKQPQQEQSPPVTLERQTEPVEPVTALQRATTAPRAATRPDDILALQRTVGNQAVSRLLVDRGDGPIPARLAHELTHTIQQGATPIQQPPNLEQTPLKPKRYHSHTFASNKTLYLKREEIIQRFLDGKKSRELFRSTESDAYNRIEEYAYQKFRENLRGKTREQKDKYIAEAREKTEQYGQHAIEAVAKGLDRALSELGFTPPSREAKLQQTATTVRKEIVHKGAEFKRDAKRLIGQKDWYRQDNSSDPEQTSLLLGDTLQEPIGDISSGHSGIRKGAVGAAKFFVGNFIRAGAAGKKARDVGIIKERILEIEEKDRDNTNEQDLEELREAANSLKGAYKRQAVWESTAGLIKKGLSLGLDAITGAPGVGEMATASLGEITTAAATTLAPKATNKMATSVAHLDEKFMGRGGKKLNEDEWVDMITKYLHHQNEEYRQIMEGLLRSASTSEEKGNDLVNKANHNPREVAKYLVAVQQGSRQKKAVRKRRRKAAEGRRNDEKDYEG